MMHPTESEVAMWISQCADAEPLVRQLAASLLTTYFAQLVTANRLLSKELAKPRLHLCPPATTSDAAD